MRQEIRRVRTGAGVEVAYAVSGSGPFLVMPPPWVSHLELGWTLAPERWFYEALSTGRTLVRYDRPGCGLSDRDATADELEVLEAVVGAVGARSFDLLGSSMGTIAAVRWAASRPETVDRLLLYGGWARGAEVAAGAAGDHVVGLVRARWGLGSDLLADILMAGADAALRAAFVNYQRESAAAEVAARELEAAYSVDLQPDLGRIGAPTLVLHREHDRAAPIAQGRALAAAIPGSQFVALPGRTHVAFLGDAASVVSAIRRFLALPRLRTAGVPGLTRRQAEVAALVAEGLTNREIAARLGITERSAEGHVERIRDRLGFRSRSQVAAWWSNSTN